MPETRPRQAQSATSPENETTSERDGPSPSALVGGAPAGVAWWRPLPELLVLASCVLLWITTSQWSSTVGGPGPAFYPRVLLALLAFCLLLRVAQEVKVIRTRPEAAPQSSATQAEGDGPLDLRYSAIALGLAVLYVWGSLWIGWVIATFLAVVVYLVMAGKRNPLVIVPTALVLSVGMAYVFIKIVYIALPTGTGIFDTVTYGLLRLMGAA